MVVIKLAFLIDAVLPEIGQIECRYYVLFWICWHYWGWRFDVCLLNCMNIKKLIMVEVFKHLFCSNIYMAGWCDDGYHVLAVPLTCCGIHTKWYVFFENLGRIQSEECTFSLVSYLFAVFLPVRALLGNLQ